MRLIDADALKPDYYDEYTFGDDEYVVRYYSEHQIDSAPSIDIVRCKECKYCEKWESENGTELYCDNPNVDPYDWGSSVNFYVKADGFCSRGERRK